MQALRFLGVSAPNAKAPVPGAFPLTITPRDNWGTMVPRLALHRRAHPEWASMVEAAQAQHRPDYALWPTLDMVGLSLGVAWFAIVEPSTVEVGEDPDSIDWSGAQPWLGVPPPTEVKGGSLPEPPDVVYLDPEFLSDFAVGEVRGVGTAAA